MRARTAAGQFQGQFKGAMEKRCRKVQKASTHPTCGVKINVGIGQRCRAAQEDVESTTLQANKAKRVTFHRGDGALHMGSIRGKAHPLPNSSSGVVMDIAAFKVNHCAEWDKDATALQATSSTQLVQRGDGMLHVGSIRGKAHRLPGTHIAKVSISSGAMEEMSRQGQNVSTQFPLR